MTAVRWHVPVGGDRWHFWQVNEAQGVSPKWGRWSRVGGSSAFPQIKAQCYASCINMKQRSTLWWKQIIRADWPCRGLVGVDEVDGRVRLVQSRLSVGTQWAKLIRFFRDSGQGHAKVKVITTSLSRSSRALPLLLHYVNWVTYTTDSRGIDRWLNEVMKAWHLAFWKHDDCPHHS